MQTLTDTYFSILKVPISFEAGEFFAVGMLMVNDSGVQLRLSQRKLKLLRDLISEEQHELLRTRIRSLRQAEKLVKEELSGKYVPDEFSFSHLQYLSRYSNNILLFSEPVHIQLKDTSLPDILFAKYVDAFVTAEKKIRKPIKDKVRSCFSKSTVSRLSWDYEISQELLPSIPVVSYKSHFAGSNGALIIGDSIDFEMQYHLFLHHLTTLELIARTADKNKLLKAYAIAKEPPKKLVKNHKQWEMLRQSHFLEYVDLSEIEKVEEFVEREGVRPVEG